MLLAHLLEAISGSVTAGRTDLEIADLQHDSRRVTPDSLFVAMPSVGSDARSGGYRVLAEVISRGASAVVVQAPYKSEAVTVVQVPDARSALADLAAAFFDHPSEQLQLFAVTGTDGKTTTS